MSAVRYYDADGRPQWRTEIDPETRLTPRQREVLHLLRSYNWNRSRVARHLACDVRNVQVIIHSIERRGVTVPTHAGRGPDLRPRKWSRYARWDGVRA